MRKIKRLSEEWIKSFCGWYNQVQSILIEAFIKYYGEEEREKITKEIDDIPFLFLLSESSYLNSKTNDYTAKMLKLYFKNNKLVLDTLSRMGYRDDRILSEATRQSMLTKYSRGSFEYYLHEEFILEPSAGTTHFDRDGTNPIVILPIYFVTDQIIFHEINHVLTTPKREGALFPIEIDEIINELIIQDVLKIFRSLGGKILPYELELRNEYENNLFLMKDFYEKFKDLIKKCVRNDDITLLEDNLGKENLKMYFMLVKRLYHKKYITDIDLERIDLLINRMARYYQTKKSCYNRVRLRKIEN